uniref:large ribosomal subunit protein mL50 n=1 Tax=Myxine glutinosa TaxID=7769 RepID=UPI00358F0781
MAAYMCRSFYLFTFQQRPRTCLLRAAPFAVYRTYSNAGGFWEKFSFGKRSKEPLGTQLPEPEPPVVPMPSSPPNLSYNPPEAAELEAFLSSVVRDAYSTHTGPEDWRCQDVTSEPGRTRLLARLARELGRTVPGSQLHEMRRGDDVRRFYSIPVRDKNRLEQMATKDLPPNIKINWDYE